MKKKNAELCDNTTINNSITVKRLKCIKIILIMNNVYQVQIFLNKKKKNDNIIYLVNLKLKL